ncbi:hypothetical protein G5V59_15415 [Nocardioides sp. W3-2-3]|uniref:hypothetical protein n=1 Tax=Nocardioides convexus TaxID=2712224 RepID=UPI003100B406|nr:hypothetical protein [Nocardioides convexus]
MPVATTTCSPRCAASATATWCAQGSPTPRDRYDASRVGSVQAGQSAVTAGRAGRLLEMGQPAGPVGQGGEPAQDRGRVAPRGRDRQRRTGLGGHVPIVSTTPDTMSPTCRRHRIW